MVTLFGCVLTCLSVVAFALIEEDVMPKMLQNCYENYPAASRTKYDIQRNCLNDYLFQLFKNDTNHGLDPSALNWIDSLGRTLHKRIKRQAKYGYGYRRLRLRKEIRTLTEKEREDFFSAVNALKKDTSERPNKYDAFALLHQNDAIPSAHGGYNFISWHRYYLVLFETALRTKVRGVTLPYWDSTLDFRMKDPAESILFSEIFIGNGKGIVYNGPFGLWRTPAENTYLRRDIPGPDSSLVDPIKLMNVFRKKYNREIFNPTAANDNDNLETHHDGVHRWVGGRNGHMNDLNTSPQDPVFWLHHCYIDYLWEKFRILQRRHGINPEEYPNTTDFYHRPDREMDYLKPPMNNSKGYSNYFTRYIYTYAPTPTCNNTCGGANKCFLSCDRKKGGCVSRTRNQFIYQGGFNLIKYWYRAVIGKQSITKALQEKLTLQTKAGGLGGATLQSEAGGPSFRTGGGGGGLTAAASPLSFSAPNTDAMREERPPPSSRPFAARIVDPRTRSRKRRSVNINFNNKEINFANWAATPIIIVNEHQNQISSQLITPFTENLDSGSRHLEHSTPESYDWNPTFNLTFTTYGFTYNGIHSDSITIDKRTLTSQNVALSVFKSPSMLEESKAYVTVHDSYRNICRPSCLTSNNVYIDCSGVIKITPDYPHMYIHDFETDPGAKIRPFIKFHCRN